MSITASVPSSGKLFLKSFIDASISLARLLSLEDPLKFKLDAVSLNVFKCLVVKSENKSSTSFLLSPKRPNVTPSSALASSTS